VPIDAIDLGVATLQEVFRGLAGLR
jgi:hypothetical protein